MQAIGIMMHKILRIIYDMLKNNNPYDPEIDRANRGKAVKQVMVRGTGEARRFQTHDHQAPISRRQNKKRKEQVESQNDNIIKNGIITPAPEKDNKIVEEIPMR